MPITHQIHRELRQHEGTKSTKTINDSVRDYIKKVNAQNSFCKLFLLKDSESATVFSLFTGVFVTLLLRWIIARHKIYSDTLPPTDHSV